MDWFERSGLKLTDWLGGGPAFGRAPGWHCSRSSTGPGFECWRPSVFSCVAPSGIHLASLRPVAGTDRCPGHRRYLPTTGLVSVTLLKERLQTTGVNAGVATEKYTWKDTRGWRSYLQSSYSELRLSSAGPILAAWPLWCAWKCVWRLEVLPPDAEPSSVHRMPHQRFHFHISKKALLLFPFTANPSPASCLFLLSSCDKWNLTHATLSSFFIWWTWELTRENGVNGFYFYQKKKKKLPWQP